MLHFGTNGIRGRMNELTPQFAVNMARAIGFWAKEKRSNVPILMATDYRITREMYRRSVIAGLTSAGCDVIDANVLPSPVVDYYMRTGRYSAGIIITASHNPPEWNGIKVVDNEGVAVSREVGKTLMQYFNKRPVSYEEIGKVSKTESMLAEYFSSVLKFVNTEKIKKSLTVVVDPGNGTLCDGIYAYKRLVNIIPINSQPDGNFPGRKSEPTEKNVQTLINTVKDSNADLGIAWDGDGDRVVFVDEKGNYVLGDKAFALSLLGFGGEEIRKKGPVLTTVSTSRIIEDVAKMHNLKTEYTKVGAPYLSEEANRLKKSKGIQIAMAGEEVGGIIWPEISWGKDGLFTAFKMLEMISEKPLSKWLEMIPVYHNKKIKIECPSEQKAGLMDKIKSELNKLNELDTPNTSDGPNTPNTLENENDKNMVTIDGIRINFNDGWVIIRPSGTENIIRVFAEAKTKERVDELSKRYVGLVRSHL